MAIVHADNFNYYGDDDTLLLDGVYAETYGILLSTDPDGISTEKCVLMRFTGSDYHLRWVLPSPNATVGIAARYWLTQIPADESSVPSIMSWRDGSNNVIASLKVTPTGVLRLENGSGTVLGATSGPVVTADAWYHIEAKLVCDLSAAGTFEARIEGLPVLELTGLTTTSATTAQIGTSAAAGSSSATSTYIKDLVVWDGSGSQNNDFLGSVLVYEMTPTSDVSFPTGWTSTGANGYGVLDNNPPTDGVDYISADDTPPAAAVFGLSDLPADITSVKALVTRVRAAKSDGGDGQMQVSLVSGASTDDGTDRPITVAQTYWSDVSELDPATASAWTPVSANAAQLKITRTL